MKTTPTPEEVLLSDIKDNPVLLDGKLENFTIKIKGKPFSCTCHSNVFHKPDTNIPNVYKCNGCGNLFATT
jgi:predicted SprT family Zn-dependent metalloprotease